MTLNRSVELLPVRAFLPELQAPTQVERSVGFGQVFSDAFAFGNTAVAGVHAARDFFQSNPQRPEEEPPPDYDPFEGIEGTIFEQFPEALIDVNTPVEKAQTAARLREDLEQRQRLSDAGMLGIVAMLAAGILDPMILLPVGGTIKAAKTAIATAKVLRGTKKAARLASIAATGKLTAETVSPLTTGIVSARAALLGSSASELVLQADQDTRTFGESALNVSAATFLGAVLGGSIGALSAKSRRLALRQVEEDLTAVAGGSGTFSDVKLTEADFVVPTDGSPTGAEIKLQSALGVERLATLKGSKVVISPFVRILVRSKSREAKKAVIQLVDSPVRTKGFVTGSSVEAEVLEKDGLLYEMFTAGDRLYTKYRVRIAKERGESPLFVREGGRIRRSLIGAADVLGGRTRTTSILTKKQFMREVGASSRSRDSVIPEANELAELWSERVYKPTLDDMIELKILPEEVREMGPIGARRYLQRIYDVQKLIAEEPRFKAQKIRPWVLSKITTEEREAIIKNAASDIKKGKLTADEAVDREIDLITHDIFEHLTSTTRGRIPYERVSGGRPSPFKPRALDWEDADIEEFLEQDIEVLGERYIRTIAPDLALTRKFGSVDLADQIDAIAEEYAALRVRAKTPKERAKLQRQQKEDKELLLGMAALLRGTYAVPTDNALTTSRRLIRTINYLSIGGGFALNSVPDLGMPILRNGLIRSFRTGYLPLITHFRSVKLAADELRLFGAATDLAIDTRSRVMSDVGNDFARNRPEDIARGFGAKFSVASLLAPWNAAMKSIAGTIIQTRMIRAILDEGLGRATAKEIANLEAARLTPAIRRRILAQLQTPNGRVENGPLQWSNTRAWDDLEARQEWGRALRFSVDQTILTPGVGAAPLWLSTEWGRTVFQFQRFSFGATNMLMLSSLQQRDLSTLNGILIMSTLGMFVEWSKNQLNDRPQPKGIEKWAQAGIDRSGVFGAYANIWNVGARAFGAETLSSRFAARNLVSSALGPTLGTAETLVRLGIDARKGKLSDSDVRMIRRLAPYNQIVYLSHLFDKLEEATTDYFNLPRKRSRRRKQ